MGYYVCRRPIRSYAGVEKAEFALGSASAEEKGEAEVLAEEEDAGIGEAMAAFIRKDLKWTHRELHDALLTAGVTVPSVPSTRNYIAALHAQYGDSETGFLSQSFHSHTKNIFEKFSASWAALVRSSAAN